MSLPSQVDKTGKHRAAAMKESVHSGEVYYGMGPPALEPSHSEVTAGTSGVYNLEKGQQSLGHYQQQATPVKWMHQDAMQGSGWSQEAPVTGWGQNFPSYMGGVNVRGQMAFHKGVHEGLPMGTENQMQASVEVYRDNAQAQVQWDPMQQLQAYQQQPHAAPHTLQGPMLQPFQTFRPNKQQQFNPGYYTGFPQNKAMQSLGYSEQPKTQQPQQQQPQPPLLHQIQQQQQMHHHQQQVQQQHIHMQQHLQQQHLQQQHLQQQQQQMQMQQQYRHQQQLQERQMQQIQQMAQQNVPQEVTQAMQLPPKQPQNFVSYQSPEPCQQETKKEMIIEPQKQEIHENVLETPPEKVTPNPTEPTSDTTPPAQPRRSRRLSRDGQSPTTEGWAQASKEPPSQNGVTAGQKAGESQAGTGGVIQSTRRRRRASKEINLETLAQQAAKRESLPARVVKEDGPSGRQTSMVPLVIPVSVPVPRVQLDAQGGWSHGRAGVGERGQTEHKPSVIVARRRSLRNSVTESLVQEGENDSGTDDDGKPKPKRRPRPEPLIIPPPKPSTFIPPSVYSSITSYQSNLRSPVRQLDNPLVLPPYTPPPILSPVRGGSGLYFSAFLSNMAAGNQILPPPATTKTVSVSLLRLASSETTPPLPLITDATPVSLEPRINIGEQYQAEIPELQTTSSSQFDQHKADLVWLSIKDLKHGEQENVEDLMNMACSSVLNGGGTNQELVLHCLYECGGDFLETLGRLMLQDVVFPKGHPLSDYHYSGSDSWTPEEKRYFNKGISAYRKDFFMVQKLVQTKTVAQCVEFYYTYKKQVKVGRNGILTFGPPDSPVDKHNEAVLDVKSSQQTRLTHSEVAEDDKKESSSEQNLEISHQARVAQSLQAHDYAATVLVLKEPGDVKNEPLQPLAPSRTRPEPAAKKGKAPPKPPQDPDAVFPCKKCGRVFYKVKSRSAHMKSHAEQEKKAAALRLKKEEEEQAASEARARKAALVAAVAAASHRTETRNTEQAEVSSQDDSSEGEDDDDEDWH